MNMVKRDQEGRDTENSLLQVFTLEKQQQQQLVNDIFIPPPIDPQGSAKDSQVHCCLHELQQEEKFDAEMAAGGGEDMEGSVLKHQCEILLHISSAHTCLPESCWLQELVDRSGMWGEDREEGVQLLLHFC